MTVAAVVGGHRRPGGTLWPVVWIVALAAMIGLYFLQAELPWIARYPADAVVPFADWISAVMRWIKVNLTWFTRMIKYIPIITNFKL